ncbi:carbamoyltransferase [Natrialba aegyptia DSM 13077]|uniref:Carbamoyltransferase n=1 Tax=Natrialba aegyptia DSM 13077 TaxID=1227491 RepID=M0ALJ8_9EURY|nr:carbamoyltransferase [Natrialba aegyptia DSM 13077]
MNKYVKHREDWRPFAPSILAEAADEYLCDPVVAPYMVQTFDVEPEKIAEIPAVVHPGDYTTRPQLVTRDHNPQYHQVIDYFEDITDIPVLLNTSFNDNGEPIVNTPADAISAFFSMGLDALVLEDVIVEKSALASH